MIISGLKLQNLKYHVLQFSWFFFCFVSLFSPSFFLNKIAQFEDDLELSDPLASTSRVLVYKVLEMGPRALGMLHKHLTSEPH